VWQVVTSLQEAAQQSKEGMAAGALVHQAMTLAVFHQPAGKYSMQPFISGPVLDGAYASNGMKQNRVSHATVTTASSRQVVPHGAV
jgi:hypothetical protein